MGIERLTCETQKEAGTIDLGHQLQCLTAQRIVRLCHGYQLAYPVVERLELQKRPR